MTQNQKVEKIQVKHEQPTKLAANGKRQVGMDGDKSDSLVQQPDDDQIHDHEVISKTLNVVDTCEKLDGAESIVFVDKLFDVNDPYDFSLLVMGSGNGLVLSRYDLNNGKTSFGTYFSRVSENAYMPSMENFCLTAGEKENGVLIVKVFNVLVALFSKFGKEKAGVEMFDRIGNFGCVSNK